MVNNFFSNRLLLGMLAILAFYWGGLSFLPSPYVSGMVSTLILISGSFALAQHTAPAWRVVFGEERDTMEPGSHLSVIGTFLVAFGLVYGGLINLYLLAFSDITEWIGSLTTNFSRFTIGIGMAFTFAAPQIGAKGFRIEGSLGVVLAAVMSFMMGIVVAAYMMTPDALRYIYNNENRPICPIDRPIWGSTKKVYHGPDSPYRGMISPVGCFKDAQEAEDAGYRAYR